MHCIGIISERNVIISRLYLYYDAGKELLTGNGLNEYDFGARRYYSAVPAFTSIDPLCENFRHLSPYLYCANDPVNAIDPDGKVIIFINGFHFGDGGRSKYWQGIDFQIMNEIHDKSAVYYDGAMGGYAGIGFGFSSNKSSNLNCHTRISAGIEKGYLECQKILNLATETESTIKFVSHSMGSAFTKGFIQGMQKYASDNCIDISGLIEYEVDFAPYQPIEQKAVIDKTFVFQHFYDCVAGDSPMPGETDNRLTHYDVQYNIISAWSLPFKEHSIKSFADDIANFFKNLTLK